MFTETINKAADMSLKKTEFLNQNFLGYQVASVLSGIYVGFGIILIFSIASPFAAIDSPAVRLIMGSCFGIALTLVLMAGCELFTSNTMFMTFGIARKKVSLQDSCKIWGYSWFGGLMGSAMLTHLVIASNAIEHAYPFIAQISLAKMQSPALELFTKGILCNILVCLAVWMSLRIKSETAKILVIFWCLFGFVGSGYEHSIANMTLLAVGILGNPNIESLTWGGYYYNLLWVTLGNFVGGALFIASSYLLTITPENQDYKSKTLIRRILNI